MGLFDFMDSFFYISLGVLCLLILLLIYHFKDRIHTLETKNETLLDIVHNVVKEITSLKHSINTSAFLAAPAVNLNFCNPKVEQEEEQEEEEQEEEQEEEEKVQEEEQEEEQEEKVKVQVQEEVQVQEVKVQEVQVQEKDKYTKNVLVFSLSDDDEDDSIDDEDEEEDEEDDEEEEEEELIKKDSSNELQFHFGDNIVDTEFTDLNVVAAADDLTLNDVVINVNPVTNTTSSVPPSSSSSSSVKHPYSKLTLSQLKTLAVAQGMQCDISKLKKTELIKLLLESPSPSS